MNKKKLLYNANSLIYDSAGGFFVLCSFTQPTEQNLFSRYSNGTLPVISVAQLKHRVITAPERLTIRRSAASAL